MIARTILAAISLCTCCTYAGIIAVAQDEVMARFSGHVFADGRPVNWMVQVRLERADSSLVAYAYTKGSSEFVFDLVSLQANQQHYLVINEPGFKELRYEFDIGDLHANVFTPDLPTPEAAKRNPSWKPSAQKVYTNGKIFLLELERLPGKNAGQEHITGPKVIDIRQHEAQQEFDLATENFEKGDSAAAVKHLERVVQLSPEYYDAVNKLGSEYLKAGQYEKAEAMLNRARSLNPKDPIPPTNLGILYFQEGEKLASSTADDVDTDIDDDAEAAMEPGEASYRKAIEVLEEALRLDPQKPRPSLYLGMALYKVGDDERAESLLLNTLALDQQMHEAHLSLLNIYIRQKRYSAALEQISAYLKANPDSPQRQQIEKFRIQIEKILSQ